MQLAVGVTRRQMLCFSRLYSIYNDNKCNVKGIVIQINLPSHGPRGHHVRGSVYYRGVDRSRQVLLHLDECQQHFLAVAALEVEKHTSIDEFACLVELVNFADCAAKMDCLHLQVARSRHNPVPQALELRTKLQNTLADDAFRHMSCIMPPK
jgi:hypothetical protein